ncbi:tandem-95 repeat protein [Bacteroidota bacterium]
MSSYGQRGIIFDPAIGNVLDPNADGFVSETTSGFSTDGYYPDEFEFKMFGIPVYKEGEVLNDILAGAQCGTTDLTPDTDGFSVYGVLDDNDNLIFRFRITGDRPSVESYTILIDTDQRMGDEDPNSTANNPGFEIDITLIKNQNKGVFVYNIDGIESCPTPDLSYAFDTHVQKAIAGLTSCGDEDFFYDYFVPFADLEAAYGITLDTDVRFAAVTNVSATCAMAGAISDIGGVDNNEFGSCLSCAFLALSEVTCPTSLNNLCGTCEGFLYGFTEKPEIAKPLKAGQNYVSGTSEASADIFIEVYSGLGTLIERDTIPADTEGYWVTMLQAPLTTMDSVTARAKIEGRCHSGISESDLSFAIVQEALPPVISGLTDTLTYIENDGAVQIEPTLTITDPDDSILTRAIISIDLNYTSPEDILGFTNQNGITGIFNFGSGILNLSGIASVGQYQSALSSVTYENTSEDPNDALRNVTFIVFDSLSNSDTISLFIKVVPVNDAPAISGTSTPLVYTFGDGDVIVDPSISITDLDHTELTGATVQISNNYSPGEDILTFTDQNGIVGSFDAVTGTLTLNGTTSLTDYAAALSSIIYNNTSGTPSELTRQISYSVFDGVDSSNVHIRLIDYDSNNNPPEIVDENGNPLDTIYITTEEDAPIELCLNVEDPDGDITTITSAISINGNTSTLISLENLLCFDIIPALNYFGNDTLRVIVCDQGIPPLCDTLTVIAEIIAVNDPPVITGNSTELTYTEGDGAVEVDNSIAITDVDNISLTGASIQIITNYVASEDLLEFSDQNGITGTYDPGSGLLSLSGSASLTDYSTALGGITYTNSSLNPDISPRSVSFRVFDGSDSSNVFLRQLNVISVNQPPEIIDENTSSIDTLYVSIQEDSIFNVCLEALDPDGDSVNIAAKISRLNNISFIDEIENDLCFDLKPKIDFFGQDTLDIITCDDGNPILCDSLIIIAEVIPINDKPIIFGNPEPLGYTEGDGAVVIDNILGVFDIDDTTLTGATIQISVNYVSTEDIIEFTDQNGISGTYDSGSGTLTLTGSASIEDYSAALASITYTNDSLNADLSTRTISFRVYDGNDSSDVHTRNIDFTAENFPPEIIDDLGASLDTLYISTQEDTPVEICLNAIDPDGDIIYISSLVPISASFNFTVGSIVDLCLNLTPFEDYNGTDIFQLKVCDQVSPSLCDSLVVYAEVTPVNDPPVLGGDETDLQYTEGDGAVEIDPSISIEDVDDSSIDAAVIQISSNYISDQDLLEFSDQNGISGSYENTTATLSLTGPATLDQFITALASITYSNSSVNPDTSAREVSFRVFDGTDSSNVFTRNITIISVNVPPEIIDENDDPIDTLLITMDEDIPLELCLSFWDPDEDNVSINSGNTISGNIVLEIIDTSDFCINLIPDQDFYGFDTLQVIACDDGFPSLCDTVIIIADVLPVNDPPAINGDNVAIQYTEGDGPVIVDPTIVVTDIDNDNLSGATVWISNNYISTEDVLSFSNQSGITGTYDPVTGIYLLDGVALLADYTAALASVTFENTNLSADLSTRRISFIVFDGNDSSAIFSRDVDFISENLPPVVIDSTSNQTDTIYVSTNEDTPVTECIDVLDPDGDLVSISSGVTITENTDIIYDPDNGLCFDVIPNQDFFGIDTVLIVVCDKGTPSLCDSVIVIIDVLPVNDPPSFLFNGEEVDTVYLSSLEDQTFEVCFGISDVEEDPFEIVDGYTHTGNGNYETDPPGDLCFVFDPEPDYNGSEIGQITGCETVTDGLCDSVIIVFDIAPVNDPPEIVDEFKLPADTIWVEILEDSIVNICIDAVDIDGDDVTLTDVESITGNGEVDNGILDDLCFTFDPEAYFNGREILEIVVCDNGAPSLCDTAIVIIDVLPVNNPPVILINGLPTDSLFLITDEDTPLNFCFDATDIDGDALDVSDVIPVNPNGLMEEGSGTGICFNFNPEENYFGESTWIIEICDDGDPVLCATLNIIIEVVSVNDAPVAEPDSVTVLRNHTINANVLDNDWDVDSESLIVNTTPEANPFHGELTLFENGDFEYKPDKAFHGDDYFTYTICDNGDPTECDFADVIIIVEDIPVTVYQALSPNGDGMNDYLRIEGIDLFDQNVIRIYDRYNNLVFEEIGYNNDSKAWHGQSNRGFTRKDLPEDTYFYIINLGDGSGLLNGYIVLKR